MTGEAADPAVEGYARALVEVATAEGALERVDDELFTFAQAVSGNTELRERLRDDRLGVAQRLEIVDDLLGGRAHPQTLAAVSYVVQSGRARQIGEIAETVSQLAASSRSQSVALVRSAVELDAGQRERLGAALAKATGNPVSVKVVVDPQVVGGLVVSLGDEIIDGSVARRLAQMRTALTV